MRIVSANLTIPRRLLFYAYMTGIVSSGALFWLSRLKDPAPDYLSHMVSRSFMEYDGFCFVLSTGVIDGGCQLFLSIFKIGMIDL